MKKFKNNTGITLMSLVITIIILIILASVGTYSGIQIINSSKLTAFTTELKIMQTKVNELYDKKEYTIGKETSTVKTQADKVFTSSESGITNQEGYRYYDQETIKNLGIEGVEGEFFVNVQKRSVVSYKGLKYEGNTYYTLNQLPNNSLYNVQYNIDITSNKPTFDLNVERVKKNEYKVSVKNIIYDGNINNWNLKYKLDKEENFKESENLNVKLYEEGTYKFKIVNGNFESEERKIEITDSITEYIKNHVEDYYGHYVTNYNSPNDAGINAPNGKKWQIFMTDDENIYLITSNYVTRQYTGTKNNVGYDYDEENKTPTTATKMWFTSIVEQYNANSTITDIPVILSKLDKQSTYHKWMNTVANQTRNYNNEKAVASMIDVDVWSGYKNSTYAKYAIGGPTIEMFCKSYNDTRTSGIEQLKAQDVNDDSTCGYKIKKGTADPTTDVEELKTGAVNNLVDNMYFKSSSEGKYYWLASPAALGKNSLFNVYPYGRVSTRGYLDVNVGFCPIVCLKSDISLVLNEDKETYSIVNY